MINLRYTIQDIKNAVESRFGLDFTEDEIYNFVRERQNQMEDRISELCWEVIQNTFETELPKFTADQKQNWGFCPTHGAAMDEFGCPECLD